MFAGYWGHAVAAVDAFRDGGWFRTGDIGSIDEDGYVRIVGRTKELIISGGHNVNPREVEETLGAHPNIIEVAVAGVPSEAWGEAVTAWVVGDPGLTADDVIQFARDQLAPYKCPKAVHFVASLPRNSLGKVLKHELA